MATTDNLGDFLTSVANAIRSKSGSTAQINAQDFASEIENLPSGGTELPEYMSAKNFTFDGNSCTGYVGDNTLPEIIIPKSYSTVTSIETVVGAKVLDKENLSMSIYDFQSATFSDGGTNTQTYTSTSQLQNLSTDFPNDCYLVSMQGSNPFSFDFLQMASDMQMLQFPIAVNGQSFNDGQSAFEYIQINNITNVNFGGDVEVTKFVDGNDYQVTSVSGSSNGSGFKNYQNRIILLSNLTSIGTNAFSECHSLTNIVIPSSVTSIDRTAFEYCSSLQITVEEGNVNYSSDNGSLYNKVQTKLIRGSGGVSAVNILDTVTSIGLYAFSGCSSLTNIEIPSSVTSIGNYAFSGCSSLTNIEIPSGVTRIGDSTFSDCSSLTTVTIPSTVTSIGGYAFNSCSSLTSIEIPSGVTSIGFWAFKGCESLTSIEIPSTVTNISDTAFYNCSNLQITVDSNNPNYSSESGSLYNKAKTTLIRGAGGVSTVTISSGVTSIKYRSFLGCSSLTSVTIPSTVTSIGWGVFEDCSSLTSMRVEATTPPTLQTTDAISTATKKIYIPAGTLSAYQSATNWSNFADKFEELPA